MWVSIAIYNPLLSLMAVAVLPISQIVDPTQNYQVLYNMAYVAMNKKIWLSTMISIDAIMVLTGAVLTAYVGVLGLVRTMSQDRVLPSFFLQKNPCRKTNHWIVIGFFLLASSLMFITKGKVDLLSGVFTMAFLSVMSFFAIGNALLKYKRRRLKREITASWITVLIGLGSVVCGLIGNILFDARIVGYFAIYFTGVMIIILVMFYRVQLLRIVIYLLQEANVYRYLGRTVARFGKALKEHPIVFFTKNGDLPVIHKAILYVIRNEITNWLRIVHCYEEEDAIPPNLIADVKLLDRIFPKVKIDCVLVKGAFSPDLVKALGEQLKVSQNMMFITCPGDQFEHDISLFGGVRVITH